MKIIVMTGATSGLGAEALKIFAKTPETLILVGARGTGRIVPEGVEVYPLDLSSLASVRSFAERIQQRIGKDPIDCLALNAGAQFGGNEKKSKDGFELTFATNHLSHYLLARLLWPNIGRGSRIVFTTSDTHDPEKVPMGPKTLEPIELAYPTVHNFKKRMQAYPSSKLCNLLTARSLASISILENRNITVIAYNPGLTGGTDFGGKPSPLMKILLPTVLYPFFRFVSIFKPSFFVGNAARSGEALAELTTGMITPPKGKVYASLVRNKITFPDPSKLAQSDDVRDFLWRQSAIMVEMPEDILV